MARVEALRPLPSALSPDQLRPEERAVIAALRDLSFGSVEVTVHHSRIVQLSRNEKIRFEPE
jgi:hypothetical protein